MAGWLTGWLQRLGLLRDTGAGDAARGAPAAKQGAAGSGRAGGPPRKPLYVDVRTPQEFAGGHLKGALNIPHDQMPQRWKELERHRERPIVLYCRSGRRSGLALKVLKRQGFLQVENGGGYERLRARVAAKSRT